MAIMVILFGMLFVPLSTSIDMASAGQARTQMQQHLQMAMQRINRGLANATYIYLPEYIPLAGADGTPLTADDEYLINYSNITFQPPGAAVRYAVMTRDYTIEDIGGYYYCVPTAPELDNPWILYRMEGEMRDDVVVGRNLFGASDSTGQFVIGYWSSRNALTPARNADIPVTRTICLDANGYLVQPLSSTFLWAKGYVALGDLDDNGTNDIEEAFGSDGVMLVYIHDGVKFGPLRVENERLAPTANRHQSTFEAEYPHWLGLPNPVVTGPYSVGDAIWGPIPGPMLINSSELRPRIVVRRETTDPDDPWVMDTDALDPAIGQPLGVLNGAVINNIYGISWNSAQGTVTLATTAGPAIIDFDQGINSLSIPPLADDVWDFVATDASSSTVQFLPGSDVYDEDVVHTTLNAAANLLDTSIQVDDASQFSEGEWIRIVDADNISNYDDVMIAAGGISGNTITFAPALTNSYVAGDWVRQTNDPNFQYRRAYSRYGLVPYVEPAVAVADKMVVPDSVRVRVTAIGALGTASKEYRRVLFADPSTPTPAELANIGYGEFGIQRAAPGDYRAITIHFANGALGTDGQFVPPPSPDDPSTFGGTSAGWDVGDLTAFWIEISYNVRRNFSTATPALRNDQIDVSYSTRAVYNVSLELLPWRYYEDNDNDHIWTPYQHIKGVHLQAQIPIAALGG